MLLQRLKALRDTSFNFDYMGAAEYEFGAGGHGRELLARLVMAGDFAGKAAKFVEINGRYEGKPIDVFVFGAKEYIASIPEVMIIDVTKETFRTDDDRIQAWMRVSRTRTRSFDPMLIVRATDDNIRRGNEFIGNFVSQIITAEKDDSVYQQDVHEATMAMVEEQEKIFDRKEQLHRDKVR